MAKFEVKTPGYTYYFEARKIRGKQAWELIQGGIRVANISESVHSGLYLHYRFEFTDGSKPFNIQHDSVVKAIRHLAKHHGERLRSKALYAEPSTNDITSEPNPDETIWPIPDLASWTLPILRQNLEIYKGETPDAYTEYRIAELTAEIERREARVAELTEVLQLPPNLRNGTIGRMGAFGCPPLIVQFGEVGGLRLETIEPVTTVMAAIITALEEAGFTDIAEHGRKLYLSGMTPILERVQNNG